MDADGGGVRGRSDMAEAVEAGSRALRPCVRRTNAGELPLPLILEMLSVAIRQGSSIPRALIAVGDIAAGEFGAGLRSAGEQLNKGVSWDDAWPDDGDLAVVRDAFASSWHSGASPVERLETAVEQLDWDERSQIEQAAAKLSVRLLLPTGLCFLPAFVAVGIIPSVMSFVQ